MWTRWSPVVTRLLNAWDAIQVELHGCYSIQRMQALQTYAQNTSTKRIAGVLLLTPLPCLLAIAVADCIPLQPPELGLNHSGGFWVRASLATWIYSLSMLQQFRCFIVGLPMTDWTCLVLSFPVTILTMAVTFLLVWFVGYPMPFTISVTSVPWAWFMAGVLWLRLGAFFREQAVKRFELKQFLGVLTCQVSLVIIYPAFNGVFYNPTAKVQIFLAVLLGAIKLLEKNLFSFFTNHVRDLQPEIVIFNVEVFNSLFIACCIQNSNSIVTNFALAGLDFVTSCVSLRDLDLTLAEVTALAKQMKVHPCKLQAALLATCDDLPALEQEPILKMVSSRMRQIIPRQPQSNANIVPETLGSHTEPLAATVVSHEKRVVDANAVSDIGSNRYDHEDVPVPKIVSTTKSSSSKTAVYCADLARSSRVDPTVTHLETKGDNAPDTMKALVASLKESLTSRLQRLRPEDRVVYVRRLLPALYLTEFLLLIEYIEVMIPIVYAIYLVVVFHLPNRMYYPQLRDMDEQKLSHTITNVVINAILELLSLMLLIRVLNKKLCVSPLRQLAFVLDRQWRMVQSKAVLWVVVTIQSTLYHLGADYSFKFAWLSEPSKSPTTAL